MRWDCWHERRTAAPKALAPARGDGAQRPGGGMSEIPAPQVALVTGASRGIGRAIASTLATQGFRVVGTGTTEAGAAAVSQALQSQGAPAHSRGVVLNVNDAAAGDALIESIVKHDGGLHVLVNNAGVTRDQLAMRMKDDD